MIYLGTYSDEAHRGLESTSADIAVSSLVEGNAIVTLHLPELQDDWAAFYQAFARERIALSLLQTKLSMVDSEDFDGRKKVRDAFDARPDKISPALNKINAASRKLPREIMGVAE